MEKLVLVSLHNRTREVRFSSDPTSSELTMLERAIQKTVSDVPILTPGSQLIMQVSCICVCMFGRRASFRVWRGGASAPPEHNLAPPEKFTFQKVHSSNNFLTKYPL